MAGQLSVGITLKYGVSTSEAVPTTWTAVPSITTIPQLIGAPNAVDATTLADTQMVYIEGLPDAGGALAFGAIMTPELLDVSEAIQTAQNTTGSTVYFRVEFPTPLDRALQFKGRATPVSNSEVGVNARVDATLNVVPTSVVEWVELD